MGKTIKLFVGGLPPTVTKQELAFLFREFEDYIKIDLRSRDNSHLNQGFAFLLLQDPFIARRIVDQEFQIRQRKIQVQYSKKMSKKQNIIPKRLFCKGIPPDLSDADLCGFFNGFVHCRAAYSIKDSLGNKKGFGFIELFDEQSAKRLLDIKKFKVHNAHLEVEKFNRKFPIPQEFRLKNSRMKEYSSGSSSNTRIKEFHNKQQQKNNCHLKGSPPFNNVWKQQSLRTQVWKTPIKYIHKKSKDQLECINSENNNIHNFWQPITKGSIMNEQPTPFHKEVNDDMCLSQSLRIGPSTWIHRSPHTDFRTSEVRRQHELANLRFNIVARQSFE